MEKKKELEEKKKGLLESAAAKELILKQKLGTIGNIVHDSVPVNNDEVYKSTRHLQSHIANILRPGPQCAATNMGT